MRGKDTIVRTRGWTNKQIDQLKEMYSRDNVSIKELTLLINKSETSISLMARSLNLKKKRLKGIVWSKEEDEFLKKVYPEFDNTISEIAESLGKTTNAVKTRAKDLGLKKITESECLSEIGKKRCNTCRQIYTFEDFHKNSSKADGLAFQCKACESVSRKKKNLKLKNDKEDDHVKADAETKKQCILCKEVKLKTDFSESRNTCKECRNVQNRNRKIKHLKEKGYSY